MYNFTYHHNLGEKGVLRYLITHQDKKGVYTYTYFPKENSSGYGYSLIRHFGTLYALSDYANTLSAAPSTLQTHLVRGISYGLTFKVPCDSRAPSDAECINYIHDGGTFGTPSLAIVTLLKSRNLIKDGTLHTNYLNTSIALEKGIAFRFNRGNLLYPSSTPERIKRFEEGQLLLALVHLHQATNSQGYLDKAKLLKNVIFINLKKAGDISLHHWYTIGLRDYYKATKLPPTQNECLYFIESAKYISDLQEKSGVWVGSFKEDPRIATGGDTYKQHDPTITSAYVEGLGALYELISLCTQTQKTSAIIQLIKSTVEQSMLHITKQQITLNHIMFKGFSVNSLGGIYRNDSSYSIQIDTPQHALSAYMVYKTLEKR